MNLVLFGDSITEAAEVDREAGWPRLLEARLNGWSLARFHVYNRGVGGDTSSQALERLGRDVLTLLPGVVLVEFGLNDANVRDWCLVPQVSLEEFRRNLREIHRAVAAHGGFTVFVVNHRLGRVAGAQGNGRPYPENVEPYNDAIRMLAGELELPAIDLPRLMDLQGLGAADLVAADGLHLSAEGNRHYADLVYAGLWPILERHAVQGTGPFADTARHLAEH